jgi:hypothetical protein
LAPLQAGEKKEKNGPKGEKEGQKFDAVASLLEMKDRKAIF